MKLAFETTFYSCREYLSQKKILERFAIDCEKSAVSIFDNRHQVGTKCHLKTEVVLF